MFRRTFGEPRGEFCYRLFKRRRTECEDCPAARTFADGGSYTSRHLGQAQDGKETHYVVSTAPLLQGDGETTHSDRQFLVRLWWAFRQVQDPGNMMQDPASLVAVVVSVVLTVVGLFLVSLYGGLTS